MVQKLSQNHPHSPTDLQTGNLVFQCLVHIPESAAHLYSLNPEKSLTNTQEVQSLREKRPGVAEVDAFHCVPSPKSHAIGVPRYGSQKKNRGGGLESWIIFSINSSSRNQSSEQKQ